MQASGERHGTTPHPDPENAEPAPSSAGKKHRGVVIIVGLVIVAGSVYAYRSRSNAAASAASASASAAAESRAIPVVVQAAEQRDVPVYLEGLGNALPLATVTVKSQVDGRLDKVLFKEGQTVKKGDVLAQVDPRPFVIALHQAEAALSRDSAQSKHAARDLDRYTALRAQNFVPQQQVDDQQNTADQATAAITSDRAAIDNAKLQLDYAQIKSPIDGVTGVRQVDPGNIVHASDTGGIVVVTQLDPMALIFTLPEDDLPRVSKEMAAGQLSVEAYTRDAGTLVGKGQLQLIDNQVNQATASIRLKAVFPNADKALWPNAFLKARLLLTTRKGALVVPAAAIQRGPQGSFVYVVEGGKAVVRPVTVADVGDEVSVVSSGLKPGESVVIEGQNQLRPGAKVTARPAPPPKGNPAVVKGGAEPSPSSSSQHQTAPGAPP